VLLSVEDNGVGVGAAGESGHGLGLHGALMAVAGGELALESISGRYTRGILRMPVEQKMDRDQDR
jgi:glucose-6-phosphate-specific signal transduction histidine kinase